ncbi:metal-dependent transcriptional regulator [Candidatus Poribacteria bacterium]|nr:metal-dependent transcriptional regulator [Candidatus Poribacteria bacterium]
MALFRSRRRQERVRRVLVEDTLKHVLSGMDQDRLATAKSLAGHLQTSHQEALELVADMEQHRLLSVSSAGLRLTEEGEEWALRIVRAHRLWERYLADEIGKPATALHREADRAEHRLSPDGVESLDAFLGYPREDPHGDPIPAAPGDRMQHDSTSLSEWEAGVPARVVHVEDEPASTFLELTRAGVRPGMTIEVRESGSADITLNDGSNDIVVSRAAASRVGVEAVRRHADDMPLSHLRLGEKGRVTRLDEQCRGMSRRRLLDLGIVPGTIVECALSSMFSDPCAYRVRGSMIALRRDQSERIRVVRESRSI